MTSAHPAVSRRFLTGVVVAGLFLAATVLASASTAARADTAAAEPTDVVLLVGADDSHRTVAWYSDAASADAEATPTLEWAPASALSGDTFPADAASAVEPYDSGDTHDGRVYHHATMDGLEADTEYAYRVGAEGAWSDVRTFATGTDSGLEAIVVGDPQLGASGDIDADRAGWEATLAAAREQVPGAQLLMSLGDQVDSAANEDQYRALLDPLAATGLPLATVPGNHDEGSGAYATHLPMPHTGERQDHWYVAGDVLVIGLDSNGLDVDAMDAAIGTALAEAGDQADWHVVAFHHTAFGVAQHSNEPEVVDFRGAIAPVLSEHGIDVALMGHDHTYARTHLMDGRTPVESPDAAQVHPEQGEVLYLTLNSSSGSKYYPILSDEELHAADAHGFDYAAATWQEQVPSFTALRTEGDTLTLTTHRADTGEPYDQVTLQREGAPEPTASPSTPASATPSPSPTVTSQTADAQGTWGATAWVAIAVGVALVGAGGIALWRRAR